RLHDDIHVTSVFVTHDQEEALEVSDRVVVMNHGRVEQDGSPEAVYDHPANAFGYQFLGSVNRFGARVRDGVAQIGPLQVPAPEYASQPDSAAVAYVRPYDIDVLPGASAASLHARIDLVSVIGPRVRLELQTESSSQTVHAEMSRSRFRELGLVQGGDAWIRPRNSRIFLEDGEIRSA